MSIPALLIQGPAIGHSYVWVGPEWGDWHFAGNWQPGGVPDQPGESAFLPAGSLVQILNYLWPSPSSVTIRNGGTLHLGGAGLSSAVQVEGKLIGLGGLAGNVFVTDSGRIEIPSNWSLGFHGPVLRNDGVVLVNDLVEFRTSSLYILGATELSSPSGTGALLLDPVRALARLVTASGVVLTHRFGHLIRGAGEIDATIVNEGRIQATSPSRVLGYAGGVLTNLGIVEARDGGWFRFVSPPSNYSGGVLTGGGWHVQASSRIDWPGMDIRTNSADIVLDGIDARFTGGTTPGGALALLTSNAGNGTLAVRNGAALQVATPFVNSGLVTVGAASAWTLSGMGSLVQTEGSIVLDGGTLATPGTVDLRGGVLRGNGALAGDLVNAATIEPGLPAGLLTIGGDFSQSDAGRLVVEIGGTAPSEHDRMRISGSASVRGTLRIETIEGFEPAVGDSFEVMTFGQAPSALPRLENNLRPNGVTLVPVLRQEPPALLLAAIEAIASSPLDAAVVALQPMALGTPGFALDLDRASWVEIELFDVLGRRVATLDRGERTAGRHLYRLGPLGLSSGVYLARAVVRAGILERSLTARAAVLR